MSKIEYHEIGEIFEYDGVLLEVVTFPINKWVDACQFCYFYNTCTHEDIKCTRSTRKDNRDIVFRRIDESEIREIREKAIFGGIYTFFTDRELKILKMINKQKEKRNMEQKSKMDRIQEEMDKLIQNTDLIIKGSNKMFETHVTNIQSDEEIYGSLLDKLFMTYKAKNHDYSNAFSEMFDELGIDYAYGKLREKINRIKVLRNQPNMVENEGLEDALLDTAGYAILTLVELKKRKQ